MEGNLALGKVPFYVIRNSDGISDYIKGTVIYRIAKRYDETKPQAKLFVLFCKLELKAL